MVDLMSLDPSMAQPRPPAGRAGLFLNPNQIAAWFHPRMFRINIWVVIAILLVLFAVTRYLTHERQPSRVCAEDPSAPACQRCDTSSLRRFAGADLDLQIKPQNSRDLVVSGDIFILISFPG